SRTFGLLREAFPDAHALEYPSGGHFAANLASLQRQIESLGRQRAAPPLVITGASLGGFYAAQLSARLSCPCALINPVIWPQQTLRPFVGQQKHFHSGEYWQFSLKACQSYADFPDPRQTPLPRLLVL
ncbi:MAG: YqiA/YcfP family alpha/beta fold hydrolase, partial [Desulfovibrionaceae bacterium]|nr:YqiA/YcfP family alpha/beta fold hydrolase [Desulfovibrionaceae bacterium]